MKQLIGVLFLFLSITVSAEDTQYVLVGDMYVPAESIVTDDFVTRGLKQKSVNLWDQGIIRYRFASNISSAHRNLFLQSCYEMGEFADIQCLPKRSSDSHYIYVTHTNKNICGSSHLGRRGGKQDLKIKCWRRRTIQHELMHAFGISHEQNRPDRDEFITLLWQNVQPSVRFNYSKVSIGGASHYLNYYDFDSIMHYGSHSGAVAGKVAFYRTDYGPQNGIMYQRDEMSFGDHYILYALYGGQRPQ